MAAAACGGGCGGGVAVGGGDEDGGGGEAFSFHLVRCWEDDEQKYENVASDADKLATLAGKVADEARGDEAARGKGNAAGEEMEQKDSSMKGEEGREPRRGTLLMSLLEDGSNLCNNTGYHCYLY